MATVDKFLRGYELQEDNEFGQKAGDWLAGYVLKRTMYARLDHVTGVDGQSVRVGALVHRVVDIGAGEEPCDGMMTFLSAEGYTKSIIVTAICKRDKCVELEHTFALTHTQFGLLEVPDGAGCPQDHEWKCAHLGHKGKCRHRCMDCGGWWDCCYCPADSECSECPECSDDEGSVCMSD